MAKPIYRGKVKFFNPKKGWGGIESDQAPGDVWVHFSAVEGTGYRELVAGDLVDFRYEAAMQDSWCHRATRCRRVVPDST